MDGAMELNDNQLRTMRVISTYKENHGGNAPTRRELQWLLGLSGPSMAQKAVKELIDLDMLKIIDRKLCVVGEEWIPPKFLTVHRLGRK